MAKENQHIHHQGNTKRERRKIKINSNEWATDRS